MKPVEIHAYLQQKLDKQIEWNEGEKSTGDPWAVIEADGWVDACLVTRDDDQLAFDFLRSLTGTDRPDDGKIEVVAHLWSYSRRHAFVLKTTVDRDAPVLASLTSIWPAAVWYEREIYDLLGIDFSGHPDLRRIMMPNDWVGHPLRKDYTEQADYRGIPTSRPGYATAVPEKVDE